MDFGKLAAVSSLSGHKRVIFDSPTIHHFNLISPPDSLMGLRQNQSNKCRAIKRADGSLVTQHQHTLLSWRERNKALDVSFKPGGCLGLYHIELLPHGTPLPQCGCHLCDDRVLDRDDRLKLPEKASQKDSTLEIYFLERIKTTKIIDFFFTLCSWRGHSSSG